MEDDGMLLNFELGDAPLKAQIKFKGGRWRDRVRAQNGVKKRLTKSQNSEALGAGKGSDDADRPAKRQKTYGSSGGHVTIPRESDRENPPRAVGGAKPGYVTSRLFTSNPTPKTTFDEQEPVEEAEPAEPSNAPLSHEAATFHALGLSKRVAQHLSSKLEMKAPTAIQKNTIPQLVKEDSDAFLQAETGSGKTLAYLLPIVHRIMALSLNEDGSSKATKIHRNSGLFAIILAPTRELCKQIAVVLEKVLRCASWLVSTTVIGGESKKSEKARLRKGINILIATPGRLADHLDNTKVLDVGTVRWLVLDEGDRMMEMGFEDDIRTIVGKIRKDELRGENNEGVRLGGILPARRVTILCSATMKMNVQKLGEISLEDAIHITASQSDVEHDSATATGETVFSAPSQLKQSYVIVPAKLRLVTLVAFLKSAFARRGSIMKAIVFISCADSVDFHFDLLKSPPPPAESPTPKSSSSDASSAVAPSSYITSPANPQIMLHKLHGSLAQPVRTSTLHSFTTCKDPCVLITTDISSRGLDVPAVDLVVEYDPAFAVSDHVHRIGRTARAGRPGKAALFLLPGCEEGYIDLLHSTAPNAPQLYDTVLQKGLASPVNLPPSAPSGNAVAQPQPEKQSWTARAEALQLHFEQRLLAAAPTSETSAGADDKHGSVSNSSSTSKGAKMKMKQAKTSPLLDAARQAFRSHIRAYATHVREERTVFDMTQLHLGHVAKSFGLREAPGGIGGSVARRTYAPSQKKGMTGGGGGGGGAGRKRGLGAMDGDGDDEGGGGSRRGGGGGGAGAGDAFGGVSVDDDAARRMKEKMKAVMSAASEFNIG